ncbi:MAG: hypothetical protein KBT12_06480 [Bacteroidales bacterium]|nr:hypothetical protein [Candidatus Physcousia equi]
MRRLSIVFAMFLSALCMTAQPQGRERGKFNPEEFRARMDNYVREKANLTQEEADKVFPIYHEMKEKQFAIMTQIRQLKFTGRGKKNADAPQPTDADYQKAVRQINDLNVELAKLQQTYYEKMNKEVPGEKVIGIMRAEDKFHREMLGKAGERRRMFEKMRQPDDKKKDDKDRKKFSNNKMHKGDKKSHGKGKRRHGGN